MKKLMVVLLSVLAAFFFDIARAENNAAAVVETQAGVPKRGTLYRVRHQHNTSYLFGTIHVGMPTFFPLEPQVSSALKGASKLVLEIDIRDTAPFQKALQKHGLYAGNDSIEHHLSAEVLAELQAALQQYGVPFASVRHMKPWVLSNMLVSLDLARQGYHHQQGVEHFLLSQTEEQQKPVLALESADYQMSLFDGMSDAMQEQYLREHLSELDDGSMRKKSLALIDAWTKGDSDAIAQMMHDANEDKTALSDFTQRMLLDRRNPAMTDKIEALLKSDAHTFVGVGLLHLVGNGSVPALLQQRGYEVERLY